MMVVVTMATMVPPMVAMTAMVPPMVAMMTVTTPVVTVPPLYVGRQFACVALPGDDARADRSRRLRLLRGSRDNQKRAESGKS